MIEEIQEARKRPLDYPTSARPHRVYAALTNHCNRSCPWCSTYSSPAGRSWLSLADLNASLPEIGDFEVQLEGGEPTIHPDFWLFVEQCRNNTRCTRVVLCTNGAALPRSQKKLRTYLERLGKPLTIKLSINHHLLEHDSGLLMLATELRDAMVELGGDRALVLNVRLRKGIQKDDRWIEEAVRAAGLTDYANVFFLQRYGFASNEVDWEPPFIVGQNFRMINPDGSVFGPDLIARSNAMGKLP